MRSTGESFWDLPLFQRMQSSPGARGKGGWWTGEVPCWRAVEAEWWVWVVPPAASCRCSVWWGWAQTRPLSCLSLNLQQQIQLAGCLLSASVPWQPKVWSLSSCESKEVDLTKMHAVFYIRSKPPTQKYQVASSVGKGKDKTGVGGGAASGHNFLTIADKWKKQNHHEDTSVTIPNWFCHGSLRGGPGPNPVVIKHRWYPR